MTADRAMDSNHGFRKFLNDPKTSVMGYIAENIPADRLANAPQQGQGGRPPVSPRPQYAETQQQSSMQNPNQSSGNLGYQNQQEYAQGGNGGSGYGAQGQVNGPQRFSPPPPSYSQPPSSQPYVASNLSQHQQIDPRYGMPHTEATSQQGPPHQHSGLLQSISHLGQSLSSHGDQSYNPDLDYLNSSGQASGPSPAALGQGPPLPGQRRKSSPQSASRMYHRMVLEFEGLKRSYFDARSQSKPQEISTTVYELESLSRKIWTLRRDHAGDFEEYSDLGHASILASWQAQYELWADTVLDLQDAQTLTNGPRPWTGDNGTQGGSQPAWSMHQEPPGQGMHSEPPDQQQNSPYMQNSQMQPQTPNVVPSQQQPPIGMQNNQPMQSGPPIRSNQPMQPMPPGAFPQSNSPMPSNPSSGPSMPPQQQMQNNQPPQMPSQQSQPSISGPNVQPDQNMPPRPNMAPGQNMSGPNAPNMQPNQTTQQRPNMPPSQNMPPRTGPNMRPAQQVPPQNRPNMPQVQNMPSRQNMPLGNGQNASIQGGVPRPGSGAPGPVQAGQGGR